MDQGPDDYIPNPPNLGWIQRVIDLWHSGANPRPTSEEIRSSLRTIGTILYQSLWFDREAVRLLDEVSTCSLDRVPYVDIP